MMSPEEVPEVAEGSSSRRRRGHLVDAEGSDTEEGTFVNDADHTVLEDDFLSEELQTSISFKRKQKPYPRLQLPRFLQPLPGGPKTNQSNQSTRSRHVRGHSRDSDIHLDLANGHANGNFENKDGAPLDWQGDGPRQRVGYDDLTAIDWIFEYTKERQRIRMLRSKASGWLGHLNQLWDAGQIWLVLVLTGAACGVLASMINIVSNWLEDLKGGYCRHGPGGGKFYLNREFCCWGLDELSMCSDWTTWGQAFGIDVKGGKYVVEYAIFVGLSVCFAVSSAILVKEYAPYAKQSGIAEIKTVLGGFVIRRFMGTWTLVTKSVGVCLAVSSGLWLGKEGPLVHIACCCANLLMKFFPSLGENEARKREVLSAPAATGISVAFGAPIGGVMFSLEQLSYYFPDKTMWQSFVCAMVGAFTLGLVDPFRKGDIILFETTYNTSWHDFELLPFAILGVIGGVYGAFFIKLNMAIAKWRQSSRISEYPILEVFLMAAVTALANYPNVFMRAESYELTWLLFADCAKVKNDILGVCDDGHFLSSTLLLIAAALGGIFTAFTFGLRVPAGVLLPSMAVGALYGRMIGVVHQHFQTSHPDWIFFSSCEPDVPCITPGTYALVGAASALAGVTRMTVSIVVIMFELTGALDYVLPLMISVMLAKWVGDGINKRGFYESWINFRSYPYLENRDEATIPDMPVAKVMTRVEDLATLTAAGHSINSLQEFLVANLFRGFPIVEDHRRQILRGYISRTELSYALKLAKSAPRNLPPETEVFFLHQPNADPITTLDLRPWMDQTPITLNSRSTFPLTVEMFMKLGLKYVLYLHQGSLAGMLTKKDVWYILNNDKRPYDADAEEDDDDDAPLVDRRGSGRHSDSEGAGLLGEHRSQANEPPMISPYNNR